MRFTEACAPGGLGRPDRWGIASPTAAAVWVSDVFALRGSPAASDEDLVYVAAATTRDSGTEELKPLRRLGDAAAVAVLTTADGSHPAPCRLPRSWDHSEGFSATSMGPPGCQ